MKTNHLASAIVALPIATAKLEALGWRPRVGLAEVYERLLASWLAGGLNGTFDI